MTCPPPSGWCRGGTPHRLRHNRATAVRGAHGLDGVQAALGQRTVAVAERYAEVDAGKAERIAAELG